MSGYRYLLPAEKEAADICLYYDEKAGLGKAFLDDLESRIALLRRSPKIGTPIGTRVRRFKLLRFPYNIIYFIYDENIVITAIAHHRRRPNYWSDRFN